MELRESSMSDEILRSSYLLIGATDQVLGADFALNLLTAKNLCAKQKYAVIAIPVNIAKVDEVCEFVQAVQLISKNTQFILLSGGTATDNLRKVLSSGQFYRIIDSYADPRWNETLTEAQENYAQIEQSQQLFNLLNEQNENLIRLSTELEDRVAKRQQNTIKAREKLVITNQRTEGLQRALIALNRAKTISDIESLVRDAVSDALNVEWIKIELFSNPFSKQTKDMTFSCPLYQGSTQMGQVVFGRSGAKPFSANQENFLTQVAESISLAVFRLNNQKHFEVLKSQWEATFDAITRPLSLVDANYNIVRCNKAFSQKSIVGKKCYEVLFKRTSPCMNCHLGKKFRLPKQAQTNYEVTSQLLHSDQTLYINIYHDITEALKLEVQILDSSREAEIGLVGSSIAHELNNPLAGIISFIQVIKMDLKKTDPYHDDIIQMENAALRCKDIIQNLLGFSRLSPLSEPGPIDLREVIKQSKEIFELRAKSSGIEVSLDLPEIPTKIEGQINLLIQAIGHLMTMALATIVDERQKDKSSKPQLFIGLEVTSNTYSINFSTNTNPHQKKESQPYIDTSSLKDSDSLDLQVTSQIIKDHLGQLDVMSLDKFFQARVTFARPETLPKSQEVDRQI
jgi:two-component system, NtrC family, sensor kinase